mmetsp:Transcript_43777/g.59815  ORF Transcript_43777/g.59815 Transcript_43777/m.59815 type:complete len:189 (+) Transcript_43777:348-914(+)
MVDPTPRKQLEPGQASGGLTLASLESLVPCAARHLRPPPSSHDVFLGYDLSTVDAAVALPRVVLVRFQQRSSVEAHLDAKATTRVDDDDSSVVPETADVSVLAKGLSEVTLSPPSRISTTQRKQQARKARRALKQEQRQKKKKGQKPKVEGNTHDDDAAAGNDNGTREKSGEEDQPVENSEVMLNHAP